MLVEHFILPSTPENPTHKFLLPLENWCPEFTAFFVILAPNHSPTITPALAITIGSYLIRNCQFILKNIRDNPSMAQSFSEEVILVFRAFLSDLRRRSRMNALAIYTQYIFLTNFFL